MDALTQAAAAAR